MVRHLWKRLLLLLPSLWVIASLLFLFIRVAIDHQGNFLEDDESTGARGSSQPEMRQRMQRQYRHKTGQDQPLFYFRLKTLAEPDTSLRLLPPRDYRFLQEMVHRYGNWPEIAGYYQQLIYLQNHYNQIKEPSLRNNQNRQLNVLFLNTEPEKVYHGISELAPSRMSLPDNRLHGKWILQLTSSFTEVIQSAKPWRSLIPVIHWNGWQNQYHHWLLGLGQGDWGISLRDSRPVTDIIGEALSHTLLLTLVSIVLVFLFATFIGVFLMHQSHFRWRKPVLTFLYALDTIPLFLLTLGLLLLLTGSGLLSFFPSYGLGNANVEDGLLLQLFSQLYYLFIPICCLTLSALPYVTSQVYQALQQIEPQEYVLTARAKGLDEYQVIGKHVLRNALLPLITVFTGFLPSVVGGALVIEVIFAIPGMGRLMADSVMARDYPVILGVVLCLAMAKMLALLLADCLYYLADPRIRLR